MEELGSIFFLDELNILNNGYFAKLDDDDYEDDYDDDYDDEDDYDDYDDDDDFDDDDFDDEPLELYPCC